MQFRVKALNKGMLVELIDVDAASAEEARRVVASSGARVLGLPDVSPGWSPRRRKGFDLVVFNHQLHSLLEAGQTVVDTIEVLGRSDRRGRHRGVYDTLLQSLQQGNQLSDAMASLPSVFPSLYVAMVRASETTGTVRAAIERFMQYQRQVDEIRGKLTAATTYPAILLSVGFTVIAFLMLYVLPRFSAVYDDVGSAQKEGTAGFVQMWGGFVRHNTTLAWSCLACIFAVIAILVLHPAVRGAAYQRLMKLPWIGERVWILQLARLYRTLGMLLHSGVSVLAAMRMTQASLPPVMQADLMAATLAVSEGRPMSTVMSDYKLSTEVAQRLLLAGESSGNLDDMMERIADFYDQETAIWIDTAGRLIEPVLMVGIGLVIGAIVLMLYSPIFDLANIV